ncbi:hypothetical protein BJX64DRAFT_292459 [Aspergillus heterothallicus]
MPTISKTRLLASALVTVLLTVASARPTDAENYNNLGLIEPTWTVPAFPGAVPITLNGTAEQVHAKLLELNPHYDEDFPDTEAEAEADSATYTGLESDSSLDRRRVEHDVTCDPEGRAGHRHVKSGISYLRKLAKENKIQPRLPPMRCARVSCSYRTGIFWCNDDETNEKVLPSWNNIADGAQVITDFCHDSFYFGGELNHNDKWRVILKRSTHNC